MNTSLAITISPPHRYESGTKVRNPNRDLFEQDRIQIKAIMRYIRCGTYIIYPELDPKGRLHYHGIINLDINQRVRFYKYAHYKLKMIGFVDLKPLKSLQDKLRWIIYITKEWGITRSILEISRPIIKHLQNETECQFIK